MKDQIIKFHTQFTLFSAIIGWLYMASALVAFFATRVKKREEA